MSVADIFEPIKKSRVKTLNNYAEGFSGRSSLNPLEAWCLQNRQVSGKSRNYWV